MRTKTVWQTHAPTGLLIGPTVADESPMEPGVWLIPAGAVETPPPAESPGRGKGWRWDGAEWVSAKLPKARRSLRQRVAAAVGALIGG